MNGARLAASFTCPPYMSAQHMYLNAHKIYHINAIPTSLELRRGFQFWLFFYQIKGE